MTSGRNVHKTAVMTVDAGIISEEYLQGRTRANTGYAVFTFSGPHLRLFSQQVINLEIYRRFQQEEIELAYPTRTLCLHDTETGS